jgi:hypothetical protein
MLFVWDEGFGLVVVVVVVVVVINFRFGRKDNEGCCCSCCVSEIFQNDDTNRRSDEDDDDDDSVVLVKEKFNNSNRETNTKTRIGYFHCGCTWEYNNKDCDCFGIIVMDDVFAILIMSSEENINDSRFQTEKGYVRFLWHTLDICRHSKYYVCQKRCLLVNYGHSCLDMSIVIHGSHGVPKYLTGTTFLIVGFRFDEEIQATISLPICECDNTTMYPIR